MSQAGLLDVESSHPQIPTQFDANSGSAIPVANILNVLGNTVDNATYASPLFSTGSGSTITYNIQVAAAITGAPADKNSAGIASFDDTVFSVDSNGYVTLAGGSTGIDTVNTDVSGPVVPTGAGEITVTGTNVYSDGSVANTLTLNLQATQYSFLYGNGPQTPMVEVGPLLNGQLLIGSTGAPPAPGYITSSDSSITITNGLNTINMAVAGGTTVGKTITGNSGGSLSPTAGNWNILTNNSTVVFAGSGSTLTQDFGKTNLALGSNLSTVSGTGNVCLGNTAGNSLTTANDNVFLGTNAGTGATSGGLNIAIGSNALTSAGAAADNIAIGYNAMTAANNVNANSNVAIGSQSCIALTQGNDTVAIGYQSLNQITTGGSNVAVGYQAGSSYTSTESFNILIGNSVTGTLGESNVTRIGSNQNACYIDGIDGVNVGNVVKVVTMASDRLGTANITAGTGITVAGTANTITINATGSGLTWSDQGGSTSVTANTGSFSTAAITLTLPASPSIGQICAFVASTSGALVIQAAGTQVINLGNTASSAGGTATSSAKGDVLYLVYQASSDDWFALSSVGIWSLA